MKRILIILAFSTISFNGFCGGIDAVVPHPAHATMQKGHFPLAGAAIKCDPAIGDAAINAIASFSAQLSYLSGKTSSVSTPIGLKSSVDNGSAKGLIFLKDTSLAPEEYSISVGQRFATVSANDYNGFLYALQTIKQLLPPEFYGSVRVEGLKWTLPCCDIKDKPRFAYRGLHLDSSRHFWDVSEVKKYLDVMAMLKLNRLHWHLTDDQGWRIEIKAYPLLNQISCFREGTMIGKDFKSNDGIRYGGYYSQEEIRDIVSYAEKLGITIIPEIDLPGHMLAAMAAYPWLGCTGGPYATWTVWGISDQVLCPGKKTTFEFLEKVFTELTDLFPGEYIHIGGDECPKTEWEKCPDCQRLIAELGLKDDEKATAEQYLQNHVTAHMQNFLASKGKKIIGWDEILEGNLVSGATVMSWRGSAGGKLAASKGFDVIMTPNDYCYIDYYQSEDTDNEPLSIGGLVTFDKLYSLEPTEGLSPDQSKHILGVQCNLWTEYIATNEHLEYMLLPRLFALSEVQWCEASDKNLDRCKTAVKEHEFKILDIMGYNYRKFTDNE